jgi:hypothetical protein
MKPVIQSIALGAAIVMSVIGEALILLRLAVGVGSLWLEGSIMALGIAVLTRTVWGISTASDQARQWKSGREPDALPHVAPNGTVDASSVAATATDPHLQP